MNLIKQLLHNLFSDKNLTDLESLNLPRPISVLDIGARDGLSWPWNNAKPSNINVILVEPDPEEAGILSKNKDISVLPYALWDKQTTLTLNLNNSPGTSSVFDANMDFLKQFANSERFLPKNKIEVKTQTIDNLAKNNELGNIDFIKIDVQGAELAILKGGAHYLNKNLIGLEAEVEFSPIYKDQPLFSELEIFVRQALGLELWDIRKSYWKYKQNHYKNPTKGRLIFGDALFLRPVSTLDAWLINIEQSVAKEKLMMLIVTTMAYGYLDYTDSLINTSFSKQYLSSKEKEQLIKHLNKLHKSFYPFKYGLSLLYQPLQVLANCFKPSHQGWASSDASQHLGSRKKGFFWF